MLIQDEAISTLSAPSPRGFYSQAVRAGDFLFISGQLPLSAEGELIGNDISEQTLQTLQNLEAILAAADMSLSDLSQCTLYICDIGLWEDVNRVYSNFLKDVPVPPARAVVPVKELHFGALVEIQAIAHHRRPAR
jgi:2-iminobutanoate/2-iminopropanoate deaminase